MTAATELESKARQQERGFRLLEMTPATGAEITGIDVAAGLDEKTFIAVRDAIHRYAVVVVRDQVLTPADELAFVKRLGTLPKEPYTRFSVPGAPELMILSNIRENGQPIGSMDAGGIWHTDKLHTPLPNMYTVLYALQVPMKDGVPLGDTWFTNTAAAYDALSEAMKRRIVLLKAVHNHAVSLERKNQNGLLNRPPVVGAKARRAAEHPVVTVHPITGRKCLYVTEGHTAGISGLPEDESAALLSELWAHITRPEFVYRHSWQVGDLLIWDNRSSQHKATFDYGDIPRRIHRGETTGPAPVGVSRAA